MRPIEQVYINDGTDGFYNKNLTPLPDYRNLVESAGLVVLRMVECGGCRGDIVMLVRDRKRRRYGLAIIGYGSCSGCDQILQCDGDLKALDELRQEIFKSISWFRKSGDIAEIRENWARANRWHTHDPSVLDAVELIEQYIKEIEASHAPTK